MKSENNEKAARRFAILCLALQNERAVLADTSAMRKLTPLGFKSFPSSTCWS